MNFAGKATSFYAGSLIQEDKTWPLAALLMHALRSCKGWRWCAGAKRSLALSVKQIGRLIAQPYPVSAWLWQILCTNGRFRSNSPNHNHQLRLSPCFWRYQLSSWVLGWVQHRNVCSVCRPKYKGFGVENGHMLTPASILYPVYQPPDSQLLIATPTTRPGFAPFSDPSSKLRVALLWCLSNKSDRRSCRRWAITARDKVSWTQSSRAWNDATRRVASSLLSSTWIPISFLSPRTTPIQLAKMIWFIYIQYSILLCFHIDDFQSLPQFHQFHIHYHTLPSLPAHEANKRTTESWVSGYCGDRLHHAHPYRK